MRYIYTLYKARRLTVAEVLAIQSLPKEYELPSDMSLTDMFKTVGNGVPYLASKQMATSIKAYLESVYNESHGIQHYTSYSQIAQKCAV
jgi:DNA (cytosine-5)-methyltransferase 1